MVCFKYYSFGQPTQTTIFGSNARETASHMTRKIGVALTEVQNVF